MVKELISIIIPIYNVKDCLKVCLDSVIHQTYANLEIILIDDGSTDGSGKIADEYAARDVRISVVHQKNQGLSASRNKGIRKAKGDYLSFIDADDFVSERFIEELYYLIKKYDAQISACSYVHGKNCKLTTYTKNKKEICLTADECLAQWHSKLKNMETVVWNKLYHKEIFLDDAIRFPVGKIHEDIEITHLLVEKSSKIVFSTEVLYAYQIRKNSLVNSKVSLKKMIDLREAQEKRLYFFKEKGYQEAYERLLICSQEYRILGYCKAICELESREEAKKERNIFMKKYDKTIESHQCNVLMQCLFRLFYYLPGIITLSYKVLHCCR